MPTKWRSYRDHRFCDVASPYVYLDRTCFRFRHFELRGLRVADYFNCVRYVQLMAHDYDDVPKMAEKGTSVSPGLRSFISLETTKVLTLLCVFSL